MSGIAVPVLFSWSIAAIFAAAGLFQLAGFRVVREAYTRWHYPPRFYRVTGTLQILAAAFLATGETRIWGIFLAGLITFMAVVTLLNHRQYIYALPGMLLLVALAPATLSISI